MTTAEEKKAAEANGTEILKEVRSDNVSDGSSEDIPTYEKRNRKAECIYISIAVVLGAALIGVLVYFSVTNAFDSKEAEPVAGKNTGGDTTDMYTTTEIMSTTEVGGNMGSGGLTRDSGPSGGSGQLRRGVPGPGEEGGIFIGGSETTTTTEASPPPGPLTRGLPGPPAGGLLRRVVGPPTENPPETDSSNEAKTTTTTSPPPPPPTTEAPVTTPQAPAVRNLRNLRVNPRLGVPPAENEELPASTSEDITTRPTAPTQKTTEGTE